MAFRLVTLNANGLRSADRKGFFAWAEAADADCMGLQEVRASPEQVAGRLDRIGALQGHFHCGERAGYAGVAVYSRHAPSDVVCGFGSREFDPEGRWLELRFDTPSRRLSVISCYFPSGSSSPERQAAKFRFLARIYPHLRRLRAEREFVLMGDVNIAHQAIDLKNWRANRDHSGFLPEERAWMTKLLHPARGGLVDVFRALHPAQVQYTWWSQRGNAWANDVGWRIDYQLATRALAATATGAAVHRTPRFSDHAPLTVDYGFTL